MPSIESDRISHLDRPAKRLIDVTTKKIVNLQIDQSPL